MAYSKVLRRVVGWRTMVGCKSYGIMDTTVKGRATGSRQMVTEVLQKVDVRVGGERPWDIQVHDERFFDRVLSEGSLGAGESYMDGWWDCEAIDELFYRVLRGNLAKHFGKTWRHTWNLLRARLLNLQSTRRAREVGQVHYDRGNDLFERMLDRRMIYSCGYWRDAKTLDEAQEAKLDLICRKLMLEPGMRLLDIGCGWGGFARYAAEEYGAEVVGITISKEQATLARERCTGLPVEIRLQDYREVAELFDRVVSIGMFEHVGYKNYEAYMEVVRRCLPEEGLSLLHTIGRHRSETITDPWVEKYIFPKGNIPSAGQVADAIERRFIVEDWHNFGHDYYHTLKAWHRNFEAHWEEIADRYGERFRRMWRYYLLQSAGSLRARRNQVWQIVLSPRGVEDGYRSVR